MQELVGGPPYPRHSSAGSPSLMQFYRIKGGNHRSPSRPQRVINWPVALHLRRVGHPPVSRRLIKCKINFTLCNV
jgi:hypothetical protein